MLYQLVVFAIVAVAFGYASYVLLPRPARVRAHAFLVALVSRVAPGLAMRIASRTRAADPGCGTCGGCAASSAPAADDIRVVQLHRTLRSR